MQTYVGMPAQWGQRPLGYQDAAGPQPMVSHH
jgi:hypothetical protein